MAPTSLGRSRPRSCKPGNSRRVAAGDSWFTFPPVRRALIPGTRCEIASHASRTCRDPCGTGIPTSQESGRRQSLEDLAVELVPAIAAARDEANHANPEDPIQHITLMGHSFGGLLVRTAYLIAAHQYEDKLQQESPWWRLVDQDRAFRIAEPRHREAAFRVARQTRDATVVWTSRSPHSRSAGGLGSDHEPPDSLDSFPGHVTRRNPIVVQFLGKGDQWVDREDSFDIEQFPNAWQSDVPGASHTDLHQVAEGDVARYAILRQGILEAKPANQRDGTSRRRNPVVIVLHGIRASNETWAEQVRTEIAESTERVGRGADLRILSHARLRSPVAASEEGASATESSTVNCSSSTRVRASVSSDIATAPICWGSPSDGLPGMQFDRVTLAASVLPRDYRWATRFSRGQVREVSNHRAADDSDSIVCNLLHRPA